MAEKKTGGVRKKAAATSGKQTKKKPVSKPAKKKPVKKKTVKETKATRKSNSNRTQKASRDKPSDVYTASGVRLTVKEAKFIDEYVATGNGRQSVINAGYTTIPHIQAYQLLKNPYIKEEIQHRMDLHEENSIADRAEIMQFWTDMMRGKILDQFDMPTTNSDKLKAAAELAKRGMDIEDRIKEKKEVGTAPEIKISLKWDEEGEQ